MKKIRQGHLSLPPRVRRIHSTELEGHFPDPSPERPWAWMKREGYNQETLTEGFWTTVLEFAENFTYAKSKGEIGEIVKRNKRFFYTRKTKSLESTRFYVDRTTLPALTHPTLIEALHNGGYHHEEIQRELSDTKEHQRRYLKIKIKKGMKEKQAEHKKHSKGERVGAKKRDKEAAPTPYRHPKGIEQKL